MAKDPINRPIRDTGARRKYSTGAVRDRGKDNEVQFRRFDLIPGYVLHRDANHMGRGAAKYDARNWEKGMPLSDFYNSAMSHMAKFADGYDDEDHLAAARWNLGCLMEGQRRIALGLWPKEMDDLSGPFMGATPNY